MPHIPTSHIYMIWASFSIQMTLLYALTVGTFKPTSNLEMRRLRLILLPCWFLCKKPNKNHFWESINFANVFCTSTTVNYPKKIIWKWYFVRHRIMYFQTEIFIARQYFSVFSPYPWTTNLFAYLNLWLFLLQTGVQ